MISHLGAYLPAIPVKNDEARVLIRHMAIDAVVRDRMSYLWMALDFMTAQAMIGKCGQILLGCVNIVASQASQGR